MNVRHIELVAFWMLSRCLLDFSVGVRAFVIGLDQISSLFSWSLDNIKLNKLVHCISRLLLNVLTRIWKKKYNLKSWQLYNSVKMHLNVTIVEIPKTSHAFHTAGSSFFRGLRRLLLLRSFLHKPVMISSAYSLRISLSTFLVCLEIHDWNLYPKLHCLLKPKAQS